MKMANQNIKQDTLKYANGQTSMIDKMADRFRYFIPYSVRPAATSTVASITTGTMGLPVTVGGDGVAVGHEGEEEEDS